MWALCRGQRHCSWIVTSQVSTVQGTKGIFHESHDTIHTFKNYFATVFSIFSFSKNKLYPNEPLVFSTVFFFFFLEDNKYIVLSTYIKEILWGLDLCSIVRMQHRENATCACDVAFSLCYINPNLTNFPWYMYLNNIFVVFQKKKQYTIEKSKTLLIYVLYHLLRFGICCLPYMCFLWKSLEL